LSISPTRSSGLRNFKRPTVILNGWIQIGLYFAVLTALVVPLGRFMARVFEGEWTFLAPVFRPLERGLFRLAGIDETREQTWISAGPGFVATAGTAANALEQRKPRPWLSWRGQSNRLHSLS
jgi:hypothetical protein